MTLHDTLKPLTLGYSDDVNPIALLKHADRYHLPNSWISVFLKLTQDSTGRRLAFLEVPQL
jgi:hypothetical protein